MPKEKIPQKKGKPYEKKYSLGKSEQSVTINEADHLMPQHTIPLLK